VQWIKKRLPFPPQQEKSEGTHAKDAKTSSGPRIWGTRGERPSSKSYQDAAPTRLQQKQEPDVNETKKVQLGGKFAARGGET